MLAYPQPITWRSVDTVTTRSATLLTIGLVAVLMVSIALSAMFVVDISERTSGILTTVLGSLATVLTGLLVFLRMESVSSKVEGVSDKADEAALKASVAAERATVVESKVEQVHHDLLNGGLRDNVKRAISEDRHAQANRATVTINRLELEELKRRAAERRESS